ncbi:hypothetical protein EDB99_107285 [Pseudomonas sp. 460]|nr:hypothetical protein EDB99_107285 [Pseudomonas sp. 460]
MGCREAYCAGKSMFFDVDASTVKPSDLRPPKVLRSNFSRLKIIHLLWRDAGEFLKPLKGAHLAR